MAKEDEATRAARFEARSRGGKKRWAKFKSAEEISEFARQAAWQRHYRMPRDEKVAMATKAGLASWEARCRREAEARAAEAAKEAPESVVGSELGTL